MEQVDNQWTTNCGEMEGNYNNLTESKFQHGSVELWKTI
jgi:hypothetical protein